MEVTAIVGKYFESALERVEGVFVVVAQLLLEAVAIPVGIPSLEILGY